MGRLGLLLNSMEETLAWHRSQIDQLPEGRYKEKHEEVHARVHEVIQMARPLDESGDAYARVIIKELATEFVNLVGVIRRMPEHRQ